MGKWIDGIVNRPLSLLVYVNWMMHFPIKHRWIIDRGNIDDGSYSWRLISEAVARRGFVKKVFLEISQNLQENACASCARVSFLIKLQASGLHIYWKRDSATGVFRWILRNLQNTSGVCLCNFNCCIMNCSFELILRLTLSSKFFSFRTHTLNSSE